jgi:hypothetical protein
MWLKPTRRSALGEASRYSVGRWRAGRDGAVAGAAAKDRKLGGAFGRAMAWMLSEGGEIIDLASLIYTFDRCPPRKTSPALVPFHSLPAPLVWRPTTCLAPTTPSTFHHEVLSRRSSLCPKLWLPGPRRPHCSTGRDGGESERPHQAQRRRLPSPHAPQPARGRLPW